MDTYLMAVLFVLVIAYLIGLAAIDTAAEQRKNVNKGQAIMLGLFFYASYGIDFLLVLSSKG
ncbi:MAG: hypothetical protein IJ355_06060 [Prevotella sp.]|nr:hypothetical protein [Prevotella sp.]